MTDEPRNSGDFISSEAFTVRELREIALKGKTGEISRPLAVALLGRKSYAGKVRDMKSLVLDEEETPRIRHQAAQVLGQTGSRSAVEALEGALGVKDPLTLRGVLHGLSVSGRKKSLTFLAPLKRRRGAVGESASWARTVLGYRLGEPGSELPAVKARALLKLDPKKSSAVEVGAARGKKVQAALETVSSRLPGLALTGRGALSIECGKQRLMLLFDESVLGKGSVQRVAGRKALPAVIAEYASDVDVGWEPKHYVLTEPLKGGAIRIVVTTIRGRMVMEGRGTVGEGRIDFELKGVDAPGAVPVDVRGSWDGRRLTFSRARSAARIRRAPGPSERS